MVRCASRLIKFISVFIFVTIASGQNLVPNGSFEHHDKRLFYTGRITPLHNWFVPNSGTPDLFSPYNWIPYKNNANEFGIQTPQDGNSYVMIGFCLGTGYEYISVELTKKLEEDSLYCISFYVSFAEKSKFIVDGLGIDISKTQPNVNRRFYLEDCFKRGENAYKYEYYHGDNVMLNSDLVNDTKQWNKISFVFRSKGDESFLTIGIFKEYSQLKFYNTIYKREMEFAKFGHCTYYIDNVSMVEISDSNQCPCYKQKLSANNHATSMLPYDSLPTGTPIALNNVLFETGCSSLLTESYPTLQELATFMKNNPEVKVDILGHTDNQGDSTMNMNLSRSRAEAVVNYIISNGIDPSRLNATGFGATKPIAGNDSEQGRQKNRRVEIVIIRKQ